MGRGLFIVVEGIDRCGKTVQLKRIMTHLESRGWRALPMAFPGEPIIFLAFFSFSLKHSSTSAEQYQGAQFQNFNQRLVSTGSFVAEDRCTGVGLLIDEYLRGRSRKMSPECMHLLFSANRWEQQHLLRSFLESGVSIVCDRYAYSGMAYAVGAAGLPLEWAKHPDTGLIRPDIVFQLDADPIVCSKRTSYGNEVYENVEVQRKVREAFKLFHNLPWWVDITEPNADAGSSTPNSALDAKQQEAQSLNAVTEKILEHLNKVLDSKKTVGTLDEPLFFIE